MAAAKFPALDATNQHFVKLGLIGHPVSHSISPLLHGAALSFAGLQGEYNLIDVPDEEALAARVAELVGQGYVGWNVTVPHKQAMFRLADELTDEAAKTGAVNTVKVVGIAGGGTKLVGHNTDLGGFKRDLQSFVPNVAGSVAMILGAGGAARAAVCALSECGAKEIWVAARRLDQAEELAAVADSVHAIEFAVARFASLNGPRIVINCTPIGLKTQESPDWVTSLLESASIAPDQPRYFYDMVYSRTAGDTTLLVREAAARGWICRDGLGMLLNQAALAFEFWTGVSVPADEMLQRS